MADVFDRALVRLRIKSRRKTGDFAARWLGDRDGDRDNSRALHHRARVGEIEKLSSFIDLVADTAQNAARRWSRVIDQRRVEAVTSSQ